jgi:hypothetical protein
MILRLIAMAIVLPLVASGCASSRATPRPRAPSATPWVVPREEHDSQRLLRVRLDSKEGRGRFRLLLRLRDPARYQIRATHPLFNRRLWTLDVEGERAVLVDYQQHIVCRYEGEAEIGAIPLGPFPFESLPSLLLGYLPLEPEGTPERSTSGLLSYRDALGRRWAATLDSGAVQRWELAGEETVTWEKSDDWFVLQAEEEGLDLRWKETLREALNEPLSPIEVPAEYAEGPCDLGWLHGVEDAPWEEEGEESGGPRTQNDERMTQNRLTVNRPAP